MNGLENTLMLGGIGGRRKRGPQRMRWLDGIPDSMDVPSGEDPTLPLQGARAGSLVPHTLLAHLAVAQLDGRRGSPPVSSVQRLGACVLPVTRPGRLLTLFSSSSSFSIKWDSAVVSESWKKNSKPLSDRDVSRP